MDWQLHHVNVSAPNFSETADFYRRVLGLNEGTMPVKERDRGNFAFDKDNLAWFEGQSGQIHVYRPSATFALDNNFHVNPVTHGHIAIQVGDIEAVKNRLVEAGIYFADAGHWAMQGYYQIYLLDPSMNALEINQRVSS